MNLIILCAGFGTRLYPLTEKTAKPLLPIDGKPMIDYLVKDIDKLTSLKEMILVSNARFYKDFIAWKNQSQLPCEVSVINDGTMNNETRLGAIRDLKLGLEACKSKGDVLVLAGDNLFDFELHPFVKYGESKRPAACVGVYQVADKELAKKYGLIKTDSSDKIVQFLEKPKDPPTLLASMGIYYFPSETLGLIDTYLDGHQNPDAPGYYLSWLIQKSDVYAYRFKGTWFDIGDLDSYKKADQFLKEKKA